MSHVFQYSQKAEVFLNSSVTGKMWCNRSGFLILLMVVATTLTKHCNMKTAVRKKKQEISEKS